MQRHWTVLAVVLIGGLLPSKSAAAQTGFDGVLLVRTTVKRLQNTIVQSTNGHRARFDYVGFPGFPYGLSTTRVVSCRSHRPPTSGKVRYSASVFNRAVGRG